MRTKLDDPSSKARGLLETSAAAGADHVAEEEAKPERTGQQRPLRNPEAPRTSDVDPAILEGNPRGLNLETKGAGSLFAFRMNKRQDDVPVRAKPLAFEPLPANAKTIDELLQRLPVQTEIARIEEIVAKRRAEGGIPLLSPKEMRATLPPTYAKAMERIAALTRHFNPVELYTADNLAKVKDEFLEKARDGKPENPKFTYEKSTAALRAMLREHGTSLDEIRTKLEDIKREITADRRVANTEYARLARVALIAKIDDDLATVHLAQGLERGDDRMVKDAFAVKYGHGVDNALLDAARIVFGYLVENEAHSKKRDVRRLGQGAVSEEMASFMTRAENMTAEEFKGAVEWMLDRYYRWYEDKTGSEFPAHAKFKVEIGDKYSAIDVRDKSSEGPIIGIPDKTRSYKKYLELLRHEIDMHVRQSLNGQFMFGFGGGALKVDEEVWYEGLAKHAEIAYMREMFGDESEPSLPYFTFAIALAEKGKSFVEVFEELKAMRVAAGSSEKLAAENAWIATYRAFRGHTDTSNPDAYALPKDQAYLRGWMLQSQLEARGLGYLNESAICQIAGLNLLARFEYSGKDLLFPDLNFTQDYFREVLRPRIEEEMLEDKARRAEKSREE